MDIFGIILLTSILTDIRVQTFLWEDSPSERTEPPNNITVEYDSGPSDKEEFLHVNITRCSEWKCKESWKTNPEVCYCDDACFMFGDCCLHWIEKIAQIYNITDIIRDPGSWYDSQTSNTSPHLHYFANNSRCHEFNVGNSKMDVRVISKCPSNKPETPDWKSKCEDSKSKLSNIPVTLNLSNGTQILYLNKYCAYCHGWGDKDVLRWGVQAKCPQESIPKTPADLKIFIATKCTLVFDPPFHLGNTRRCLEDKYDRCLASSKNRQTDNTLMSQCYTYNAPVDTISGSYFANPHCGLCNGVPVDQFVCIPNVVESESSRDTLGPGMPKNNLNILFNFDWNTGAWSRESVCLDNEVYYSETKACRELICPSTFQASNGRCIENDTAIFASKTYISGDSSGRQIDNISLVISVELKEDQFSYNTSYKVAEEMSKWITSHDFHVGLIRFLYMEILPDLNENEGTLNGGWSFLGSNNGHDVAYKYGVTILPISNESFSRLHKNIALQKYPSFVDGVSISLRFENFDNISNLECDKDFTLTNFSKGSLKHNGFQNIYFQPTNETVQVAFGVSRFKFTVELGITLSIHVHNVAFCRPDGISLDCPLLSYELSSYHVNGKYVKIVGRKYEYKTFEIRNDVLYICQNAKPYNRDNTQAYLTLITLSVSVASLAVLIGIHCAFPKLSANIHGKNLVSFSFALMSAQILFLVGMYAEDIFCKVIAIGQHYFWLTSFVWSCVMAFDLASKLSVFTMMKVSSSNVTSRFIRYSVISWGIPLVLVSVCCIIEYLDIGMRLEYGEHNSCWIGNQQASLVFFGIPVGLCIIFCIVCFIVVLHGIESAKRCTKTLGKRKNDKNYCVIYTKISLLLGLTWIVGFMESWVQLPVFAIMNIILNGSQGLLIFIGFIINARIFKKITKKASSTTRSTIRSSELSVITPQSK